MTLDILFLITTMVFAAIAGWLRLTDQTRNEVFKRKIDIYQRLNKIASEILLIKVAATTGQGIEDSQSSVPGHDYAKCMSENSILISQEVFNLSLPFINPTPVDANELRISFNKLSNQMANELRLKHIHKINEKLYSIFK